MNRVKIRFIFLCITLTFVFSGCTNHTTNTTENEEYMNKFYTLEDFESVAIGESNIDDVMNIAPIRYGYLTSYGCFCEYPMQDGNVIRIEFCGPDLVVRKIAVTQREHKKITWHRKTRDGLREP